MTCTYCKGYTAFQCCSGNPGTKASDPGFSEVFHHIRGGNIRKICRHWQTFFQLSPIFIGRYLNSSFFGMCCHHLMFGATCSMKVQQPFNYLFIVGSRDQASQHIFHCGLEEVSFTEQEICDFFHMVVKFFRALQATTFLAFMSASGDSFQDCRSLDFQSCPLPGVWFLLQWLGLVDVDRDDHVT